MAGKSESYGELTLSAAMDFYTGGNAPSVIGDRFDGLRKRLEERGHTPFEFLHYVVHYYKGHGNWHYLSGKYTNLLTSEKCWDAFEDWKRDRFQEVYCDARLQYKDAQRQESMGHDRTMILTKEFLTASPVSRIEMALYWMKEGKSVDEAAVLRKYGNAAAELALGAPEWLYVAPLFKQFVEANHEFTEDQEWILLWLTMKAKEI